ncbi:MAG: hypothetical protein P8Z41_10505 [Anaerolineales bacterium]|jgi:hypothetical protein
MADQSFDEKEVQKREEKGVDEKDRQDTVSSLSFAAFLIWAGVVLLLNNTGHLPVLTDFIARLNLPTSELPFEIPFIDTEGWRVFFLGAGLLVLIEILIRLVVPMYRRPIVGSIIWAAILFGLALGTWQVILPMAVIVAGLAILLRGLIR